MSLPLPKWFLDLPAEEQATRRTKLLLRMLALHATESGSLPEFSKAIGLAANTLSNCASTGSELAPQMCIKIEKFFGRDIAPRELLNPAIFSTEE